MHACPDPRACSAFVALGYMVIHCAENQAFSLIAFPNAETLTLVAGAWVATMGRSSGFSGDELRAVAVDRGGVCL